MSRLIPSLAALAAVALLSACEARNLPTDLDSAGALVPAAKLPMITGGGITVNDNSGAGPGFSVGGFSAQATGAAVSTPHAIFPKLVDIYPAKGQFQTKFTSADGDMAPDIKGHGEVVCIANLGASNTVDGGGDPDNDVWEIRVGFPSEQFGTIYGSFFVQDNGKTDYADENFGQPFNPLCGTTSLFQLEPHVSGNIKVKS